MLLPAFFLQPKETSLYYLIWKFVDVLGLVNILSSLIQDSGRFTILPLMGRIDPIALTALSSVQRSCIKSLGITAAPV